MINVEYRCVACGYIYDPEKGDDDGGIKAGTTFDKLPDDWVCPVCGVGKDMFEYRDAHITFVCEETGDDLIWK